MDDLERIKRELERQKRDRLKELAQRAELERRTDPPGTLMGFDRATGQPLVAQGGGIKPMRSLSNIGTVGDVGRAAGGGFDVGNRRSAEGFRRRSPEQEYKQLVRLILPTGIKYYVRNQKSYVELIPPIGDGIWPADITDGTVTSTGRSINDFVVLLNRPGVVDRWDGPSAVSSFYRDNHEGCGAWQISKVGFFCAPTAPLPEPIFPALFYEYEFDLNLYERLPGSPDSMSSSTPYHGPSDTTNRAGTKSVAFTWSYSWYYNFHFLEFIGPPYGTQGDLPLIGTPEGQMRASQFIRSTSSSISQGNSVFSPPSHFNYSEKFDPNRRPLIDPFLFLVTTDIFLGTGTYWSQLRADVLEAPIPQDTNGFDGRHRHFSQFETNIGVRLDEEHGRSCLYRVDLSVEIPERHTSETGNRNDFIYSYYWDNSMVVGLQGGHNQSYSYSKDEVQAPPFFEDPPTIAEDFDSHYNHSSSFPYNDAGSVLAVTGNDTVPQPAYTFIARDTEPPEQSRFSLIQDGDGIKSISPSGATLFTLPPINGSFPYDENDIKNYSTIRGGAWYFGKNTDDSLDLVPVRKWAETDAFTEANPKQVQFAHIPETDGLTYPSSAIAILSFDAGTRMALEPPQGETPPGGGGGGS